MLIYSSFFSSFFSGLTLRNKLTHDELCGAQWNVSLFWSLVVEIVSLESDGPRTYTFAVRCEFDFD